MPTTAHFHVIHIARALTSPSVALGWYRIPPFPGPREVLCCTRYPVKTFTAPSCIRTGKWTVSSRWHSRRIPRMFGSRWSLSAAKSNCSVATSQGSRWVWSMTAAELMRWLSLLHLRGIELVDDQPRARGLTRRVWAVPVLEQDALEAKPAQ